MSLIHNEQTKLSATYLNGVGIALFAVGGIAPTVGVWGGSVTPSWGLAFLSFYCLIVSFALHWIARRILRRLTP